MVYDIIQGIGSLVLLSVGICVFNYAEKNNYRDVEILSYINMVLGLYYLYKTCNTIQELMLY